MKVRSPMHSIDVRGKFGTSLIFSVWRGINYLRGLTIPANPQTSRQTAVRGEFATATRAWAGLSPAQIDAWDAYAQAHPEVDVFGNSVLVTGFNKFVGLSTRLLDIGAVIVEDAPVLSAPPVIANLIVDFTTATEINVDYDAPGAAFKVEVLLAGPIIASRRIPKGSFRHVKYLAGTTVGDTITGLITGMKYGYMVRAIQIADGQKSGNQSDSGIVA